MRDRLIVGALVVVLGWTGALAATTWEVATPGTPGCTDTNCTPCCTIQAAIEHASDGDTVSVDPGTFNEKLTPQFMDTMGDLTIEAADGPGTVLVIPPIDEGIVTSFFTGTLTVDGIDFSSPGDCGVLLGQTGPVILRDVNAINCGYTAIVIDATGPVTLERCTGTNSARTGIQVDGAASAVLTDCAGTDNPHHGIHVMNVAGTVELNNPGATGNTLDGILIEGNGETTLTGGTSDGNGRDGLSIGSAATVTVSNATVTNNGGQGIHVTGDGGGLVPGLFISHCTVNANGQGGAENGLRIREVSGPTVLTNVVTNDNGSDGVAVEGSVTGSVEVSGGEAKRNADEGYDLRPGGGVTLTGVVSSNNLDSGFVVENASSVWIEDCNADGNTSDGFSVDSSVTGACNVSGGGALGNGDEGYSLRAIGDITVFGATAGDNTSTGIEIENSARVRVEDCVSSNNPEGKGIKIDGLDPERLDEVIIRSCVTNGNGSDGAEDGIWLGHVEGPVTVSGIVSNGNGEAGLRMDNVHGPVLVARATTSFNLDMGIEFEGDVGPVKVVDSVVEGNADDGLIFYRENVDIERVEIRRSSFVGNGETGVVFIGLGGAGSFVAQCNDITGNVGGGMYLDNPVDLDARNVWWGDSTGPSGEGPGNGDTVISGPGTIFFTPWLEAAFGLPGTNCEIFRTGMDSGTLDEWDRVKP